VITERAVADLGVILALSIKASDWLAQRDINQWAVAWPNPEEQNRRILTSIEAGETWMIRDENEATMGTVALDTFSDPQLWTPVEQADPAMYMHRLIIRRKHAGLGTEVMDWACHRAHRLGLHWLRIDVWTDNIGLRNGVRRVRTLDLANYPSVALFQRPCDD